MYWVYGRYMFFVWFFLSYCFIRWFSRYSGYKFFFFLGVVGVLVGYSFDIVKVSFLLRFYFEVYGG